MSRLSVAKLATYLEEFYQGRISVNDLSLLGNGELSGLGPYMSKHHLVTSTGFVSPSEPLEYIRLVSMLWISLSATFAAQKVPSRTRK